MAQLGHGPFKVDTYFAGTREGYYDAPSVAALLLDSGLVQSTVEALTVRGSRFSDSDLGFVDLIIPYCFSV